MASNQSKRTYIIGWDGCGSLSLRLQEMDVAGPTRSTFQNKPQVSFSLFIRPVLTWIDRSTVQIHYCSVWLRRFICRFI